MKTKAGKKLRKVLALFLVLTTIWTLAGCGSQEAKSEDNTDNAAAAETVAEKPTKDRSGAEIALPDTVEDIVVLAPSIAETLMNLGYAENIVAIDTQTQAYAYENLSADLPAFDMMAPDTEQLAALEPDVVFISGMTDIGGTDPYADLKELGICVVNIPSSTSIDAIKEDILFISQCVGKADEGQKIVDDLTAEIEEIAEIGKTITDKKTVYFEIAAAPYAYSFGSNTFLNEMIELIGAENLLADQEGWLSVETESVVAANPDVIMTNVNYVEDAVGEIKSREGWGEVSAVKNNEVYYIDNQSSSLPNENIVKALKEMAVAIYPDVYEK